PDCFILKLLVILPPSISFLHLTPPMVILYLTFRCVRNTGGRAQASGKWRRAKGCSLKKEALKVRNISKEVKCEKYFYLLIAIGIVLSSLLLSPISRMEAVEQKANSVEYVEVKTIPLYEVFKTKEKWYATAYQAKTKDLESTELPAKICFAHNSAKQDQFCFETKSNKYKFQFVETLSIVPLFKKKEPKQGVLFIAKFSGGGSGTLSLITIWSYNMEGKIFINLLPTIVITEQGEYKMLSTMRGGLEGVLVTADYIWGEGETHFSPHRYKISVYQYDEEKKIFKPVGEYVTKTKYKSLDDVDKIDVIRHEIGNIQKFILNNKTK
ncbi:MAG: hypothetical protein AB1325_14535, partial [Nitrospirota bacterium]